jgi:hypothetical protein
LQAYKKDLFEMSKKKRVKDRQNEVKNKDEDEDSVIDKDKVNIASVQGRTI